jgi:hypothetical protein
MAVSWLEISLLGGLYLRQVALFAELATTAHDYTVQDSWPLPRLWSGFYFSPVFWFLIMALLTQ